MEFIIRGDKMTVTDAMKEYIKEKVSRLDKYLENSSDVRATVVVRVKGKNQTVEITIPLKNFIIRSEETRADFYEAVDKASDILERQIRKQKTRLVSKKAKTNEDFVFIDIEELEDENENNQILKRKKVEVKPMDEEEAILQMELLGHQFYMFKDVNSEKAAVVYKRNDGGYGIIEAE